MTKPQYVFDFRSLNQSRSKNELVELDEMEWKFRKFINEDGENVGNAYFFVKVQTSILKPGQS